MTRNGKLTSLLYACFGTAAPSRIKGPFGLCLGIFDNNRLGIKHLMYSRLDSNH